MITLTAIFNNPRLGLTNCRNSEPNVAYDNLKETLKSLELDEQDLKCNPTYYNYNTKL